MTLTIRDTGIGIPRAVLGRIFDPFFTTREVGHGMGLGLPLSKTIVEQYGGTIDITSVEGIGTTVTVQLRAHETNKAATPPKRKAISPAGRWRVLVIDDESLMRVALVRILDAQHDVLSAASGEEALALIASLPFDVILCDVMMPGMSGIDFYRRLAVTDPVLAAHVVFMSGGIMGATAADDLDGLSNPRLAKPFSVDRVLEVVAAARQR